MHLRVFPLNQKPSVSTLNNCNENMPSIATRILTICHSLWLTVLKLTWCNVYLTRNFRMNNSSSVFFIQWFISSNSYSIMCINPIELLCVYTLNRITRSILFTSFTNLLIYPIVVWASISSLLKKNIIRFSIEKKNSNETT